MKPLSKKLIVLLSLNKLTKQFSSLPSSCLGLSFSGDSLVAVRSEKTIEGLQITHFAQERLPFIPFQGSNPDADDYVALAQAMQSLSKAIPQQYWPLQIALPDPAAIFQVMEFDTLPVTEGERVAIARFRLEKEWSDVAKMECTTQVLNESDGHPLLLALAVQRSWLNCTREACRTAGWVPSVIDIAVNHEFNRIHDAICELKIGGALVLVEPYTWSILFWDESHRPRFVRSRWRNCDGVNGADYEVIASDIERLVRSYGLSKSGCKVGRLYLSSTEEELIELSRYLDVRMCVPSERLNVFEKFTMAPGVNAKNIAPSLFAAAVPRL